MREGIEDCIDRFCCRHVDTAVIGTERDGRVFRGFGDRRITAKDRRWCQGIMRICYHRMTAVVVDGEVFAVCSLADDTDSIFTATAVEVGHAALFTVADVFVILIITRIVGFVRPYSTILQVEVRRRAVVDDTAQVRVVCRKSERYRCIGFIIFFQNEDVTVDIDIARTYCLAVCAKIHRNVAAIGGECIVSIVSTFRYGDLTAACYGDGAVICNSCDTVTVYIDINIAVYKDITFFDFGNDTCVVVSRDDVVLAKTDAPVLIRLAFDIDVAVLNMDSRCCCRFLAVFAPTVGLDNGDTIPTHTAVYTDIKIPCVDLIACCDGQRGAALIRRVKPDGIRQRVAVFGALSDDIKSFRCLDFYVHIGSNIDADRSCCIVLDLNINSITTIH